MIEKRKMVWLGATCVTRKERSTERREVRGGTALRKKGPRGLSNGPRGPSAVAPSFMA